MILSLILHRYEITPVVGHFSMEEICALTLEPKRYQVFLKKRM